jgi:hypothetical protein
VQINVNRYLKITGKWNCAAFRVPDYKLNRTAGYWNDSSVYRHFNVAKDLKIKLSDMVIFKKNETKKLLISKA